MLPSSIYLKHERLRQRLFQHCAAIIHRMQKTQQLPTQLPVLGRYRAAQEPECVVMTRVKLLETV